MPEVTESNRCCTADGAADEKALAMTEEVIHKFTKLSTCDMSQRAAKATLTEDFLTTYLTMASNNPYDRTTNPKGIINLGTAVNRLMEKELQERLNASDAVRFNPAVHQHYSDFGGNAGLLSSISGFLQRHFSGGRPVPTNELFVMNGVTSCLDSIGFGLCDPGDVILTPTPVYGRIFTDFAERGGVDVQPLHLLPRHNDKPDRDFELLPSELEKRLHDLRRVGKRVRAFILLNPNNPLGDVYSKEDVTKLLKVCARHGVHAIVDEIYAFSVFEGPAFQSVLSIEDLPDPKRTHFLYGLSKDFGLAGFRVGIIHTRNADLQRYLNTAVNYQVVPSIVQDMASVLLADRDWCDDQFLPTFRRRLKRRHRTAAALLTVAGLSLHVCRAGLLNWLDIRPFMRECTWEEERAVFEAVLKVGVYVVPGSVMYCQTPGWLRIVVSVTEDELIAGIDRLISVLYERRQQLQQPQQLAPPQ